MPDVSSIVLNQPLQPMDVCLNDGRTYVQGTQMLARAADWIAQTSGAKAITLTACAFRAITDQGVALGPAQPAPEEAAPIGTATFSVDGTAVELGFYETGSTAPKDSLAEPCSYRLLEGGAQDDVQVFEVSAMRGIEGVMVATVQCLKTMHAGLATDMRDIWFTGLRGASIAHGVDLADTKLTMTRARMMGKSPNWQSLTKMELAGSGSRPSLMSFAFKSDEFSLTGQES